MEKIVRCVRWGYEVLSYGRNMKVILEAPLHDKDCVLGNILAAHYLSSCDPSKVNLYVKSASSKLERSTPYEKAVFETVTYLISEDKDDDLAFEMHIELLKRFPKDLVYLKRAQVLSFQMAKPVPFLNLVQQVLPENQDESYIHGMLAFPLLELGRMEEAAAASRKGYGINKEDALAHHCVRGSPMSKVKEIYDNHIWKELEKEDAIPPEVYLNALGLFLRLDVRDVLDGFKDRLELLAARLTDQTAAGPSQHEIGAGHSQTAAGPSQAAAGPSQTAAGPSQDAAGPSQGTIWALAKVGETSMAHELLEGLKFRLSKMNKKKQQVMQKAIQLVEAVYEYAKGNYKQALCLLGSDFNAIDYKATKMFGTALLMCAAKEVIRKRIKVREGSPFTWRLLEKSYAMEGDAEALNAGQRAKMLESSYF
ncbi:hypothetical protein YC2023_094483 [Brassica napus]